MGYGSTLSVFGSKFHPLNQEGIIMPFPNRFTGFRVPLFALTMVLGLISTRTTIANDADDALIAKLKESKFTLVEAIEKSEVTHGPAISAKFELEGKELHYSVYTAQQGKELDPEHNVLTELSGDATNPEWKPAVEVF